MSAAQTKKRSKGSDKSEEFLHNRSMFADRSDEEKIRGRAIQTLLYLCPEVDRMSGKGSEFDSVPNPEGIN